MMDVLMPQLSLIGIFAAFVIWNGSVVLGDKSNHVATLHLPQMLYIWPLFAFFSWPIIYPYLTLWPFALFAQVPSIASLEGMLIFRRRRLLPRLWIIVAFSGIFCVLVRFNTIVHPFTLADNRHYTFYVFRLLMSPWWMKYAVTPVYVICGWSCVQALGTKLYSDIAKMNGPVSSMVQTSNTAEGKAKPLSVPDGRTSATTSFVLLWLATTALQLVTAPLVEPRYFILPWIFWRMHVPFEQAEHGKEQASTTRKAHIAARDNRLWLETLWLLLTNAATGYIFLYWEFTWPQEPGRVQRFLW